MRKFLFIIPFYFFSAPAIAKVISTDFRQAAMNIRKILSVAVEKDTTNPPGNEAKLTSYLASMLRKKGISVREFEFAPGRKNLVARLKGSSKTLKPILLLAHLDVVGTDFQSWTLPPHHLSEKDGFLYGRGVFDDLAMAAASIEILALLKKENFKPLRDIVVALTGDEESGGTGLLDLLKKDPKIGDVGIVLNEGGGPVLNKFGEVRWLNIEAGEKTYQDYAIIAKGVAGHSSRPTTENALIRLTHALEQISKMTFPPRLLPITRTFFEEKEKKEKPEVAKAIKAILAAEGPLPESAIKSLQVRPGYLALLTSTCMPTLIAGGLRANALPSEARATVNCRILPDEEPELIRQKLIQAINDSDVEVTREKSMGSAKASPLTGGGISLIQKVAHEFWPDASVVPALQLGMTDARHFRALGVPAYGINPFPMNGDDHSRTHGADERIPISSLGPGVEFYYQLVKKLAMHPESF